MHLSSVLVIALVALFGIGETQARQLTSESVAVAGSTLIAYMPPELREPKDNGEEEAVSHLRFAVEDTVKCLRPKRIRVVVVYADRLILKNRGAAETISVNTFGQAIGAVLATPGKRAKVVAAEHGPSTLLQLLPAAAGRYWHAEGCGQ